MLSDAELSLAVGCDTKWLYNASRRLHRPLLRTVGDAIWWRLAHNLAAGVGVPLADAAVGADAVLALGADAGRVKLRATIDDAVAISVDLPRFHDSAAISIAAAFYLAVARPRGRPRKQSVSREAPPSSDLTVAPEDRTQRLLSAFQAVHHHAGTLFEASRLAEILAKAGVESVIVGDVAAAYYALDSAPKCVDLVANTAGPRAVLLADILNELQAKPRAVPVREGFRFDALLVRACEHLALRVSGVDFNISRSVSTVGEYQQLFDSAETVSVNGQSYSVIAALSLLKSRL